MSEVIIVLRGAWHTACLSVPTLATPIHRVSLEKSGKEKSTCMEIQTHGRWALIGNVAGHQLELWVGINWK